MTVRKGDTVLVLAGKDRGKRGTVERVEETKRGLGVVVQGLNMAKRHQRPRSRTQSAGILDLPVPIHVSNVQVVCPRCDKPPRVATLVRDDGTKVRACKQCGEQIESVGR
jgi:large subunit ribosomal protein L24